MNEHLRVRIAELIYGDGNELSWSRALQTADIIAWEIGERCWDCNKPMDNGVDITWVPPGTIAKWLGENGD